MWPVVHEISQQRKCCITAIHNIQAIKPSPTLLGVNSPLFIELSLAKEDGPMASGDDGE